MQNHKLDHNRRRKRRNRRIQGIIIYTAIAIGLAWFFESQATTTIIFVRHSEKELNAGDDPGVSDAGWRRTVELTRQLVDADVVAGIDAIYATSFRRAQETGKPLAEALSGSIPYLPPNQKVLSISSCSSFILSFNTF